MLAKSGLTVTNKITQVTVWVGAMAEMALRVVLPGHQFFVRVGAEEPLAASNLVSPTAGQVAAVTVTMMALAMETLKRQ